MTRAEMITQVKAEIEPIPKGAPGSPQNELRMTFWDARMNSLGRKAEFPNSFEQVYSYAVAAVRERHQDFLPAPLVL